MQFKHQDEYSFFSSGQARLTHELLYLHCGLIFVTFPQCFICFYLCSFRNIWRIPGLRNVIDYMLLMPASTIF